MPRMYSVSVDSDGYEVIGESHWQVLENTIEDLVIKIYGFKTAKARCILFHTLCIVLCGIPYLVFAYYRTYNTYKYKKSSLKHADLVCVMDNEGKFSTVYIQEMELNLSNHRDGRLRYFIYQHHRYIWMKEQGIFVNVQSLNDKLTVAMLMENMNGITKKQQIELTKLYGPNSVEVEVKSYWKLFVDEVFNPFYLFQVFSITLWSIDEYYQYAACVLVLSTVSCVTSLYQTKKMSIRHHEMAGTMSGYRVSVVRPARRGGGGGPGTSHGAAHGTAREECVVSAGRLVPGDVLVLPRSGCFVPCDALLITGTCIVNESALTGESASVMKGPAWPCNEEYSTEKHKRHTLFAGTQVIQTRFYGNNQVLAKVVRTGFYTAKGELIRSMLHPKPFDFQFYKDAVKFVIFLFCIAAVGMSYCIWLYIERGSTIGTIILRTLDIITIVVPPALPAAMTAGTIHSQARLRRQQIFCLSPARINVAGKLQCICFDKTGTLTEDSLDLYAIIPYFPERGDSFGERLADSAPLSLYSPLLQALATCHALTAVDGKLQGDPIDLNMFNFTQWVLEEPGPEDTRYDTLAPPVVKPPPATPLPPPLAEPLQQGDVDTPLDSQQQGDVEIPYEIGILKRFYFSSTHQSMGVIARVLGQPQMLYFVKGAPEKVAGMCKPDSLPTNFNQILNEYTSSGFRVIGLAYKKLPRKMKWTDAQRTRRDHLECEMCFLGLLVMQNSLKPDTADVIRDLHRANMRQLMITGDNIMTAMAVARGCGMVPSTQKLVLMTVTPPTVPDQPPPLSLEIVGEAGSPKVLGESFALALEGRTWNAIRHHYPELMPTVLRKGTVFGRFDPEQKTALVLGLSSLGLTVGMCGDGANDCGALRAAHVGVSLSTADASVFAPFTCGSGGVSCVRDLALEGRCALATSFAIFKYMALYSLIQFFSILILYNTYSILGNYQFLYIDLVLTFVMAFSLGRAAPAPALTHNTPPVSLVALPTTVPILLQVALVLVAQLAGMGLLRTQEWFTPVEGGPDVEQVVCWENTVIFIVSSLQYLVLACVYAKGEPFREAFCKNYYMVVALITQGAFIILLLLCPWQELADWMEVELLDTSNVKQTLFRFYLLIIPAVHLVLSAAIEHYKFPCLRYESDTESHEEEKAVSGKEKHVVDITDEKGQEAVFTDTEKLCSLLKFARRSFSEKLAEEPLPAAQNVWPQSLDLRPTSQIC